jgi:hypothetical protein
MVLATAGTGIDMRGWDGIAFLCANGTTAAVVAMADDSAMTVNVVNPVIEVDHATPIQLGAGFVAPGWLEAWRPTKRYVACMTATAPIYAFQYRHTGTMPPTLTPAIVRAGGRVS